MTIDEDAALPVGGAAWRWLAAMADAPDLIVVINADGYLEYVSPSSTRLLGEVPDQLVGRIACDFLGPDDRRNAALWLATASAGHDAPPLVHRLMRADGTAARFETQLRRMGTEEGRVLLVAISRDIQDRSAAEDQLNRIAEIWHLVGELMSEGLLIVDGGGVVLGVNRAMSELLGVPASDITGTSLDRYLIVVDDHGHPDPKHPMWGPRAPRTAGCRSLRMAAPVPPSGHEPAPLRGRVVQLASTSGTDQTLLLVQRVSGAVDTPVGTAGGDAEPATADGAASRAPNGRLPDLLSPRELKVLSLLTEGHDVRTVSIELGISVHTTRTYVKSILRKLEVRTQVQAVIVGLRAGLGDLASPG